MSGLIEFASLLSLIVIIISSLLVVLEKAKAAATPNPVEIRRTDR